MNQRVVQLALLLPIACAQGLNEASPSVLAQADRQTVELELGKVP